MATDVRVHRQFKADLVSHLRGLRESGSVERISRLRADLREARRLLGRFPHVGTIEFDDGGVVVRRLILRHVPYVVWFATALRGATHAVTLLRIFHARQDRRGARADG